MILFLGVSKISVFKIEKTKNYTVMSNYHLQDKNISFKAKGLLSFMLSLPEDWDYSLAGLVSVSKENTKAIRTILNELKDNGYLVIEQTRGDKGYYKYNYIIYEQPITIEKDKKSPDTQKGYAVEGDAEKGLQINTNIQNTEEQIDKSDKDDKTKKSSFFDAEEHNPLTIDLINRNFIKEDDMQIFYYDKLFDELLQDYSFRELVIINHYIIPRVMDRDYHDENGEKIENLYGYFKNSVLSNIEKLKGNEIEWDEETGWFKENDTNEIEDDLEMEI